RGRRGAPPFSSCTDSAATRTAAAERGSRKWSPAPGYAALRFDFRGCGESEGERGRVICKEQVKDTRNALSFLATRPEIDPKRIAVIGQSFGAAVAVYTAGVDRRVAACISSGGWGDGAKKFRKQHASPRA